MLLKGIGFPWNWIVEVKLWFIIKKLWWKMFITLGWTRTKTIIGILNWLIITRNLITLSFIRRI